jgi:hypothetical protein
MIEVQRNEIEQMSTQVEQVMDDCEQWKTINIIVEFISKTLMFYFRPKKTNCFGKIPFSCQGL